MANERILPSVKTTAPAIQLADLVNGEIAFHEQSGLLVRKRADGSALDVYGRLNAVNLTDVALSHYTKSEIDALITNAGGGDMLASNNLSEVNATTARTNLDVRSTAQITTEIGNAIATISLSGLGGLTQSQVDARASAVIAQEFSSAPDAYNNLQKIIAEMTDDDADFLSLTAQVTGKLDAGGVVGGRVIS